jgi:hypothetical protein
MYLPKTRYEGQREHLYDDVNAMLNGFITHSVSIGNQTFCLRSFFPSDHFLLSARVSKGQDWQLWMTAGALWMVNGVTLFDSPHSVPLAYQYLQTMPKSVVSILYHTVLALFKRQKIAAQEAQVYCYEDISRLHWSIHRGRLSYSIVPGIEYLGLNTVQQIWKIHNESEDRRVADENLYDGFKFMASVHAYKGVKKITDQEHQARMAEKDRKQAALDRFFYTKLGMMKPLSEQDLATHAPQYYAPVKSIEDLEQEMYRWVTGTDDWHDKVVNDYKARISENYQRAKEEQELRIAEYRKQRDLAEALNPVQHDTMVAYTPEQLAEFLKDRQPGVQSITDYDEGGHRDYLYDKYLSKGAAPGKLVGKDGKVLESE